MKKTNCWEVKKCGREPGGKHSLDLGTCPATTETKLHGVHGGKNGGRACWVLHSTFCGGEVQGSYGEKYKNCQQCDFYKTLRKEEGMNYILSPVLLRRLTNNNISANNNSANVKAAQLCSARE